MMTKFSIFLFLCLLIILSISIAEPKKLSNSKRSWSRISFGSRGSSSSKASKSTGGYSSRPSTSSGHLSSSGHGFESKSSSTAMIGSERASASRPTSIGNQPTRIENSLQKNPNIGFKEDIVHGTVPHANSPVPSKPPSIGFKEEIVHKPVGTQNSHLPPTSSSSDHYSRVSSPSRPPYPGTVPNAPYPISSHPNAPYPPHSTNTFGTPPPPGFHIPVHQPPHSSPHPSQSIPSAPPIYPSHNAGPWNNNHHYPQQPMGNVANPNTIFSPIYSPQPPSMSGTPFQSQHVLAQPASQPFVPGHTVIMMPGQQDSGRGLGQIFKEALVFSAVNAGVNRLINPPHHHVYESGPVGTTGTAGTAPPSVTHITYNNQYFNNYPGNNDTTMPASGQQASPFSPPPVPAGIPTGQMGTNPTPNGNKMNQAEKSTSSIVTSPPNTLSTGSSSASTVVAPTSTLENNLNQNTNSNNIQNNYDNVPQYAITDDELYKISEELFAQEEHDISNYLRMNLQARSTLNDTADVAANPLFEVLPEAYDIPSIRMIRNLYDNYEHNSLIKERKTMEKQKEENIFLDILLNTNAINTAMRWLSNHNYIDPDDFERKDILRHIWFNQFNGVTSGFERVFVSELYGDKDILGVQDWIYFNYEESRNRINYMGYVDKLDLGNKASLVKLNYEFNGILKQNATIFVGTTPELEISLYTICFYVRPNNFCPVSLGGSKFNIFTHSFRYYGKDLIDLAIPIF